MSNNIPDSEKRIDELASAARELTDLSVADQYRVLAKNGLRLSDTGWEVVYDPKGEGLQQHVTVIPIAEPQGV